MKGAAERRQRGAQPGEGPPEKGTVRSSRTLPSSGGQQKGGVVVARAIPGRRNTAKTPPEVFHSPC